VSEHLGSIGTTTNGNHPTVDAQPSSAAGEAAESYSSQSVDERLEALLQTVRTWDWRSAPGEPGPPSTSGPSEPRRSAQTTSAPTSDREGPNTAVVPPPAAPDAQTLIERTPRHAKSAPPHTEQPDETVPAPAPSLPDPPTLIVAAPAQEPPVVHSHGIPSPTTAAPLPTEPPGGPLPSPLPPPPAARPDPPTLIVATPVQQPVAALGTYEAPSAHDGLQSDSAPGIKPLETESRSRIKVVLLCVAALVVVLLIIGGIRLFSDKSQGSGPTEPPPTTAVTTTTIHAAASVDQAPLPIPSAEMTQYERGAQSLNAANITATKALTGKDAAQTVSEVVPVATIYSTALNTYSLELAYIQWPASLETAVKADQAQLVIMASYLKSIGAVSATGLDSWLAQLKAQATTTETEDNALRQELDLPKTTTFPT